MLHDWCVMHRHRLKHWLQDKLQAAGQTSASSAMIPVHSLTGFGMICEGCQGHQLQIDVGSSVSLVKGLVTKAAHTKHS